MTQNNNFSLGLRAGQFLADLISKYFTPMYIGNTRIHHYWAVLGSLFTDDELFQGLAIGIGIHDLADLINDLGNFWKQLKE